MIGVGPRRALANAFRLMESGNFPEAADAFERLAQDASSRGIPQRAAHLYLQSGRAYLLANQFEHGIILIRHGLNLLAEIQHWSALESNGQSAISELRKLGQIQAADEIQRWLKSNMRDHLEALSISREETVSRSKPPNIPEKCPFCGGTIRPNDVERLDDNSVECPYCGSTVKSDG